MQRCYVNTRQTLAPHAANGNFVFIQLVGIFVVLGLNTTHIYIFVLFLSENVLETLCANSYKGSCGNIYFFLSNTLAFHLI